MGSRDHRRFSLTVALGLVLVPVLTFLWIRLSEAHAALLWTEYYVARGPEKRGDETAYRAGKAAARAIDLAAPFPDAASAASLSLQLARSLEQQNPDAAFALTSEVLAALTRVRASGWRGIGLARLEEEVRLLGERAGARATRHP